MYMYVKNYCENSKFLELSQRVKPSKDTFEKLPFIASGYSIYMGENGQFILVPMKIIVV